MSQTKRASDAIDGADSMSAPTTPRRNAKRVKRHWADLLAALIVALMALDPNRSVTVLCLILVAVGLALTVFDEVKNARSRRAV